MARFSKLDAVNRVLRAAGEQPVSTLVSDGTNDVSLAVDILDEANLAWQTQNRRVDTEYQPDVNGNIQIGDNVLWIRTRDTDIDKEVVRRGNRLFDLTNNTDVFSDNLKVRVAQSEEFDDLPYTEQRAISAIAEREYQQRSVGDTQQDAFLGELETRCRSDARQNTDQQSLRTWLDDGVSQGIARRRHRDV